MVNTTNRTIDLEPARLVAIEQRSDKVVLVFPSQPSYSEEETHVVSFACEMHIHHGVIELNNAVLPLETEDWTVEYVHGSRACFLPVGFQVAGRVRVTFSQHDAPNLIVVGDRFELVVGSAELRR